MARVYEFNYNKTREGFFKTLEENRDFLITLNFIDAHRGFQFFNNMDFIVKADTKKKLNIAEKDALKNALFNIMFIDYKLKTDEILELIDKMQYVEVSPGGEIIFKDKAQHNLPFRVFLSLSNDHLRYMEANLFKIPFLYNSGGYLETNGEWFFKNTVVIYFEEYSSKVHGFKYEVLPFEKPKPQHMQMIQSDGNTQVFYDENGNRVAVDD